MAIVKNITHQILDRKSKHTEVKCTFDVFTDTQDNKFLQLDTYGSSSRQMRGRGGFKCLLLAEAV